MSAPSRLETPLLLLAMPQVMDPFFHKSVVLLVRHEDEDGSLGFIVNRPTELKICEILEDLEISWNGSDQSCAFFGGPVSPEMGTVLYMTANGDQPDADDSAGTAEDSEGTEDAEGSDPCPGVAFSQSLKDLELLADEPPGSFRLLLGYAGWAEGQLEKEILRNDWLIAPVDISLIFVEDNEQMWRAAVQSVGIDPDQLPAWTPSSSDSSAN